MEAISPGSYRSDQGFEYPDIIRQLPADDLETEIDIEYLLIPSISSSGRSYFSYLCNTLAL
jgi:hypothetical protein